MSSSTVGWLLFGAFTALALLALLASGIQLKRGNRHKSTHDYGSIYYTFAFIVMVLTPALFWHLLTSSSEVRGWVAFGVAIVIDVLFLAVGVAYEKWRDQGKDYAGVNKSTRNGRFYSIEGSTTQLFFRFATVALVHGGAYLLGGYAQADTGDDVATMFWPWLVSYYGILLFLIGGAYIIITVFFKWQDYYFGAGVPDGGDETAELVRPSTSDAEAGRRTSPPATLSTTQSHAVAPIATRTRRRASAAKNGYDFD